MAGLKSEEPCFPRGSTKSSNVTPSRHVPMERDTLFQDPGSKKRRRSDHTAKATKKKRSVTLKEAKSVSVTRAEVMVFSKLSVGMKILGAVQLVNEVDMVVSLPGGLTGVVSLREISDIMADRVDKFVDSDDNDANEALPDLRDLYQVGQLVPCVVSRLDRVDSAKHIDLTTRSSLFNGFTSEAQIQTGMIVSCTVVSAEPRGYVVDFGITRGFLPFKEIEDDGQKFVPGQPIMVRVVSKGSAAVSVSLREIASSKAKSSWNLSLPMLTPGTLVKATIKEKLPDGYLFTFFDAFSGTADYFNLDGRELEIGSKHSARILYIDQERKVASLSLREDIVKWQSGMQPLPVGHITTATIVAFDALRGLILSTEDNHRAYAHISQCSDKRLAKLEKEFQIGQTLRCRVMAYKPIDGALSVSLRESILSQAILSLDDVKAGDSISVTIDQVQPCGVFVNVTNHISALCPLHHVTELRNAHNKVILKLRPGKKVDARILRVDHETRRVAVTFKKTLVASTDALISSWEDVHAGVIAHGSVVTIRPDIGLFVEFYNNICGLVPLSDLKASGFTDLEKSFFRGQVVRVQVVHSNAQRQRMGLSLRISGSSSSNLIVTSETGSVAEGLLAGYDEQSIHVEFGSCKEPCTIPIHHLSDHSSNANSVFERLKKESVGSKFTIGILGRINDSMLLGTLKPLLVSAMQSGVFPKSISDLNVGDICQGYIKAVESFGAFIAFNNDLCGLCPGRMMDSPSFEVGQSVLGQVVEVDSEKKRFIVSLKPSDIKPDEPRLNALTMSYFNELDATLVDDHIDWSTLAFGNVVDAKVDVRKDFGVVFSLEPKPVKGFAIAPHNTEGASLEFGNLVKAIVLDVDRQLKIVDLNVSDEAVKQRHRYQKSANKATKKKSKRAIADLPKPGQTISSKVCLVKDNHVVVSLPDYQGRIAFALAYDYNHRITRSTLTPGTAVNVIFIGEHGSNRLLVRFDFPSLLLEGSKLWNSRIPNVGEQVQGKVVDIRNLYACVRLPNVRSKTQLVVCRIWIGHVTDDVNAKPFGEGGCINVGSEITANVISSMQRGDVLILGLSMLKETPTINTVDDVTRGSTLPAYVKAIKDNIWVALSPLVKACVHPLLVSSPGNQSFEIGQRVEATILRIDSSQSQLDASLNGVSDFKKLITPGARLTGRIRSIMKPRYLVVEIAPQIFGRVPLSEISDEFTDEPLSSFQSGQYVSVRVISINDDLSRINLSLRNNAAPISSISDCQIGQLVSGYVTDCGSKGCFVELSGTVTAQVRIADLSDRFIPDVASVFTAGKLVKGRISTVSPPNHIGLSLKESIVDPDSAGAIATVAPGSIVTGCIINIRDFGIFVRIDNDTGARVTGMAHVSEIFDEKDETISLKDRIAKYYAVGDAVRARVILVDPKSNRINLSLKHSQVDTDMNEASTEFEEKDAELAGMDIDCDVQELNIPEVEMAAALSDDDSDNECSSNAEPELSANAHQTSEDVKEKASTQSRKTMIERVRAEEAKLEHIEKRIADGERVPENVEDFERLAIASPNSSLMWCRYIAFQLSLNETQLAREVAERALTTIHYREEAELLNIWVALINLENLYGSSETRSAALERSLKACDPKKLLNRVAQMFELSDNQIECDSTHKDICKRYPESRNAWINAVGYKFRSGRPDIARPMLKQALQMLPKRKHIRFITSFALFEFKMGSVERGRTILEGVLGNYPKRVDLWSIYLDQEIRIGDQAVCRRLFDRVIHLDLSVKKMKFFFKRYLQYEREYGDEASIEHVKEAAKAFVASRVSS